MFHLIQMYCPTSVWEYHHNTLITNEKLAHYFTLKDTLGHCKVWRHWSSIISLIVWSVHMSQAKREDSLKQRKEIQIITTTVRDVILYPIIYLLFSYAYDLKSFVFTYSFKSIIHNSWKNIVCTFYSFQKSRNIPVLNVLPNEIFIQSICCILRCTNCLLRFKYVFS